MFYGKMPPLRKILTPWSHYVRLIDIHALERSDAINAWLNANAHDGWRFHGTVKPTDEERDLIKVARTNTQAMGKSFPTLAFIVQFEFKSLTDAVMFRMMYDDFEQNVAR